MVGARHKEGGAPEYLWLIHTIMWLKPTQHCKAIILPLKKKINSKKRNKQKPLLVHGSSPPVPVRARSPLMSTFSTLSVLRPHLTQPLPSCQIVSFPPRKARPRPECRTVPSGSSKAHPAPDGSLPCPCLPLPVFHDRYWQLHPSSHSGPKL